MMVKMHYTAGCSVNGFFSPMRINVRIQRLGPAASKVPKIDSGGETKTS